MSGMTPDITTFVNDRLDEEQAAAELGASGRHGHLDRDNYGCLLADPARVLAQVAAMRAIVEAAQEYSPELEHGDNGEWAFDLTLRHLAAIWRDHEAYAPAWTPEGE